MDTASPLLQLPEEIWTCMVFSSLTDIRDRVSACLACRRFYTWWGSNVLQDVHQRHVALTAGRFVQRWDEHAAAPQLQFVLERHGPRFDWLQLLARFLACCAPAGYQFSSYLRPRLCDSALRDFDSTSQAADTDQGGSPVELHRAEHSARERSGQQAGAGSAVPPAAPCVWVSLPPGFQPNPQQPHPAVTDGYCVGHLSRSTAGTIVCLLMSGAARSYYFELPSLRLELSIDAAQRTAQARLQLCHLRPVLRPGVDVWELPP